MNNSEGKIGLKNNHSINPFITDGINRSRIQTYKHTPLSQQTKILLLEILLKQLTRLLFLGFFVTMYFVLRRTFKSRDFPMLEFYCIIFFPTYSKTCSTFSSKGTF